MEGVERGAVVLHPLDGPTEAGTGMVREDPMALSKLIHLVNERFGTDFTEADQLFFDQIVEAAMQDREVTAAAGANAADKFRLVLGDLLETLFIERMDQNEEIFAKYTSDPAFRQPVDTWMAAQVQKRSRDLGS